MSNNKKIINLSSPDGKPMMIDETRLIKIGRDLYDKPSGLFAFVQKFLNKHKHIEKTVSLDITDVNVDSHLIVKDRQALFAILCGNQKVEQRSLPLKIQLTQLEEPFYLLFNTDQIEDCDFIPRENELKTFHISYRLVLKDAEGNLINGIDNAGKEGELEGIDLQFILEKNRPILKFIKNEENNPLQYKSGIGVQKIGSLVLLLPNTLKYAPTVDFNSKLTVYDKDHQEMSDFLVVKSKGQVIPCVEERNLKTQTLKNGKATMVRAYDIFLDVDKIKNPMEEIAKYTISCDCEYKYSYEGVFKPMSPVVQPVDILKDKQGTELLVNVAYRDNEIKSGNDNSWNVPKIEFTASNLTYPVKFYLRNKATDISRAGAGLVISNLQIRSITPGNVVLFDKNQATCPISQVVTLNGQDPMIETRQGIVVANGEDSMTSFSINFTPQDIYTIRCEGNKIYNFTIETIVEFDYMEDSDGLGNAEKKHFKGIVSWNLFKKPNPEWLCLDYGSSAIVCYYGKGSDSQLINLREARTKVYQQAKKDTEKNPNGFDDEEIKDNIEQKTSFLPSDILLHDVKDAKATGLCSQLDNKSEIRYNSMAVILSPTEKLSVVNFRRQLPCLKVLMGNKFLPKNDHYNQFRYYYMDGGTLKEGTASELRETQYSLLQIDNIFKETYFTLFHYFVQDETILEQANKIVLTYPNTYTPRNLMTLKNIVTDTLPCIREVQFVSESDAVAAYYMDHWTDYHSDDDDIMKDENILVYDMGAGTLDVTYLTKRYDKKTDKYVLEISGKIGTGCAGNYLDHVIAQSLYDVCREDGFKKSWAGIDMKAVEQEVLEARVQLKSVIKNIVKPALNKSSIVKFKIGKDSFTIAPVAIVEHPLFIDFLKHVTKDIWQNLEKYVGSDKFRVDTVIMSGRSMRLTQLQSGIVELAGSATCIMLDNVINGNDKNKVNDRSKTAVVEGAKKVAETYMSEETPVKIRSRRLQASYGVAFKRTGGTWEYHELLSKNDIPFNDENKSGEFRRPGGPLQVNHTNDSDVLLFIQTYLSEADTKEALEKCDEEFISIMSEVMMGDLGNKASLSLDVIVDRNNNVSLYADGMETQYKAPAGLDLGNEIIKKSLWPVSISND